MKKSEKIAEINNILTAKIAEEKAVRAKSEADYRERVAELLKMAQEHRERATDDPEEQQDGDQPTQWINGEQWSCAVVARRILNKLPSIPYNCSVDIALNHYSEDGISLQIKAYNPQRKEKCFEEVWLSKDDEPEKQAADISDWLERAEKLLDFKSDNSFVDDTISHAMDAWFGGSPLDDFPTLNREEAENE